MSSRYRVVIPSNTAHLAKRLAQPFSKRKLLHAARMMGPTLVALTFAGVAHAQGTMDFSGAQTLMGSFKTFAIYAGAVICFGGLIFAGIRMMSGRFNSSPSSRFMNPPPTHASLSSNPSLRNWPRASGNTASSNPSPFAPMPIPMALRSLRAHVDSVPHN